MAVLLLVGGTMAFGSNVRHTLHTALSSGTQSVNMPVWSTQVRYDGEAGRGWVTGNEFVRATATDLTAFRTSDGSQAWDYPMPAGLRICAAGPQFADGVAVFGYASDAGGCAGVAAIDLHDGRQVWSAPLPQSASLGALGSTGALRLAVGADQVFATTPTGVVALAGHTGHRLWIAPAPAACLDEDVGVTAAGTVVAVQSCGTLRLVGYASANGAQQWARALPDTAGSNGTLLAAEPLVVQLSGQSTGLRVLTDDPRGPRAARLLSIPADGAFGQLASPDTGTGSSTRVRALVSGSTLVIPASDASAPSDPDELAAFSLTTGRRLWTASTGGGTVFPIDVRAGQVRALVAGDSTASLRRYALSNGAGSQAGSWSSDDVDPIDPTLVSTASGDLIGVLASDSDLVYALSGN